MKCCCPQIVATESFENQTSALSATTIFTPDADGTFVIHLVNNNSSSNTSGSLGVASLTTTDEFGVSVTENPTAQNSSGTVSELTKTYRLKSGDAIQVSAGLQGGGSITYDVYVVVVQLA